jgi:hypothetical protein
MSSTLNDTMKTAIHGVEAVKEGTEHTVASTIAALAKGATAVSGVITMLRSLDRDDGLAWFGLARKRPLRSAAILGVGVAVGAGLALIFAPMAGAELRNALMGRTRQPQRPESFTNSATDAMKDATEIHAASASQSPRPGSTTPTPRPASTTPVPKEHDLGYGASHGYDQTHGGPTGPGDAPAKSTDGATPSANHRSTGHHGSA